MYHRGIYHISFSGKGVPISNGITRASDWSHAHPLTIYHYWQWDNKMEQPARNRVVRGLHCVFLYILYFCTPLSQCLPHLRPLYQVKAACAGASSPLNCLWGQRESLSEQCKVLDIRDGRAVAFSTVHTFHTQRMENGFGGGGLLAPPSGRRLDLGGAPPTPTHPQVTPLDTQLTLFQGNPSCLSQEPLF